MMLKDKQLKMLAPFQVLKCSALLMNPQLLPSHTVLTRSKEKRMLSCSISEVELLMSHFLLSTMVSSKSLPPQVTLISVVKTLTSVLLNTSQRLFKRSTTLISKRMYVLSKNLNQKLKRPNVIFLLYCKLKSQLRVYWTVLILRKLSLVLVSKNFAMIFLRRPSSQYSKCLTTLVSRNPKLTKLFLSVAQLVSQRSSNL